MHITPKDGDRISQQFDVDMDKHDNTHFGPQNKRGARRRAEETKQMMMPMLNELQPAGLMTVGASHYILKTS